MISSKYACDDDVHIILVLVKPGAICITDLIYNYCC